MLGDPITGVVRRSGASEYMRVRVDIARCAIREIIAVHRVPTRLLVAGFEVRLIRRRARYRVRRERRRENLDAHEVSVM